MEESPFQNREIREMFGDIKRDLSRIEGQTIKTNGRVSWLEKKHYLTAGAVGVLTTVVVPILAWALWVLVTIQSQVHTAVDEALSAYDISNVKD